MVDKGQQFSPWHSVVTFLRNLNLKTSRNPTIPPVPNQKSKVRHRFECALTNITARTSHDFSRLLVGGDGGSSAGFGYANSHRLAFTLHVHGFAWGGIQRECGCGFATSHIGTDALGRRSPGGGVARFSSSPCFQLSVGEQRRSPRSARGNAD